MDIKDLKNKIDSSPFFTLDPVTHKSLRETEKNRLIRMLSEYGMEYVQKRDCKNSDEGCEYGYEIVMTIVACLDAFDLEKGESFFSYFRCALENNYRTWTETERIDKLSHGIGFDKRKLYTVCRLIREEEACQDGNVNRPEFVRLVSEEIGVSEKGAVKYIEFAVEKVIEMNARMDSEEEDGYAQYGDAIGDPLAEKAFIDIEGSGCDVLWGIMQETFGKLHGKQKKLIAMLITAKLFADADIWDELKEYAFFDEEVFNLCLERNRSLTDREIAEMTGQFESAVSRSWNGFMSKLRSRRSA